MQSRNLEIVKTDKIDRDVSKYIETQSNYENNSLLNSEINEANEIAMEGGAEDKL